MRDESKLTLDYEPIGNSAGNVGWIAYAALGLCCAVAGFIAVTFWSYVLQKSFNPIYGVNVYFLRAPAKTYNVFLPHFYLVPSVVAFGVALRYWLRTRHRIMRITWEVALLLGVLTLLPCIIW